MLTKIQKEKFLSIAGKEYNGKSEKGEFQTKFPYNDKKCPTSPWWFRFYIDTNNRNLYCELDHRMTNNRMYGWSKKGVELPHEEVTKIFPNTDPFVAMLNGDMKNKKEEILNLLKTKYTV